MKIKPNQRKHNKAHSCNLYGQPQSKFFQRNVDELQYMLLWKVLMQVLIVQVCIVGKAFHS